MILLGVGRSDTSAVAISIAEKIANLRIFEDDQGERAGIALAHDRGASRVGGEPTLFGYREQRYPIEPREDWVRREDLRDFLGGRRERPGSCRRCRHRNRRD